MEDHSVSKLMQHSPLLCLDERGIVVRCSISWKELSNVQDNHPGEGTVEITTIKLAEGAPGNEFITHFVYSLYRDDQVCIIVSFRKLHGHF